MAPTGRGSAIARAVRPDLIAHSLRPVLKGYSLAWLSWFTPRLLKLISRAKHLRQCKDSEEYNARLQSIKHDLLNTLKRSIELHRFPAFCGIVSGGLTLLQPLFETLLLRNASLLPSQRRYFATLIASTLSAGVGLHVLQTTPNSDETTPGGRTIDLTIFAVVRALDVVVGSLWQRHKTRRMGLGKWNWAEKGLGGITDAAVFAASSGFVMYTWVYTPERLPGAYRRWIADIADAEPRIVEALKRVKEGTFVYGQPGQRDLLGAYAHEKLNMPTDLGDPEVTIPVPCIVVHEGVTHSCEVHALWRFAKGFRYAFVMYFTLNLLVRIRHPNLRGLWHAIFNSARSSTFLGAFIGLFWYAVCCSRNRIGPYVCSNATTRENWDTFFGSAACGWSILLETPKRRAEIAFFVAPRALAAILPRTYERRHRWKEVAAFAVSTGIVLTAAKENNKQVRGVLGRVLGGVLKQ